MVPEANILSGAAVVALAAISSLALFFWVWRDRQRRRNAEAGLLETENRLRDAEAELRAARLRLVQLEAEVDGMRRRVEAQNSDLDNTRERAREAARTKSLFVANMSHELRTPLNGILGLTRNLLDASLTPRQRNEVELIRLAGEDLMRIVNDVLDLSKLESGKMELERIPFNLPELLEGIFALLYPQAERRQISYALCYSHLMQHRFLGDPFRIRQVALNLLSNALKFTSSGSVTIRLEAGHRAAGFMWVRLSVEDTGIGISREKQQLIFDEFQQADLSTTRKFGGTGLGLSLCKYLVELLGGEITLESELDRGSSFRVSMPLKPIMILSDDADEAAETEKNPLEGLRLLVQRRHTPQSKALWSVLEALPGPHYHAFEHLDELAVAVDNPNAGHWDGVVTMASSPAFAGGDGQRWLANLGTQAPLLIVLNDTGAEGAAAWWSMLRSVELGVPVLPSQAISVLMQLRQAPLGPLFESAGMTAFDVYTGTPATEHASPLMLVAHENPVQLRLLEGMAGKLGFSYASVSDAPSLSRAIKDNRPRMLLVQENMLGAAATALLGGSGDEGAEALIRVMLVGDADGRVQAHLLANRIPFEVLPAAPRLAEIKAAIELLTQPTSSPV